MEIVVYIIYIYIFLDGWGDYKYDKCFSCGCNVIVGLVNIWLDVVWLCIRMCDYILGCFFRLLVVILDKILLNYVLIVYLLVIGVYVFKCINWIFVMVWLFFVV